MMPLLLTLGLATWMSKCVDITYRELRRQGASKAYAAQQAVPFCKCLRRTHSASRCPVPVESPYDPTLPGKDSPEGPF